MSKPYKEYKVNELKELLKERGLVASGTKSELINRLEEADAQKFAAPAEPAAAVDEKQPESAPGPAEPAAAPSSSEPVKGDDGVSSAGASEADSAQTDAAGADSAQADAAGADATEADATEADAAEADAAQDDASQAAAAPKLSDEELLAKFKTDMSAKIERAKRFGGDTSELEARLRRIEKFGISAVRDAAEKANTSAPARHAGHARRKNRNRKRSGPKPATA